MPENENPWKTESSRSRFENPWIEVVQNRVINPSGNEGEYTVVHFKHRAVAVIPIDEQQNTWLVGQYRFPTNTYEWEIPEGGSKPNESPLECAKRELREETGLIARRWDLISQDVQLSNCVSDERAYSYIARELSQGAAEPEETEVLQLRKVPLQEAFQMAVDGTIRDALSVISLLKLQALIVSELIDI